MTDPKDIEALAAAEHESWAGWIRWELSQIEKEILKDADPHQASDIVGLDLVAVLEHFNRLPCVIRWRRQMATPYADLSEKEKESDRKVAREKLPAYRPEEAA